MLFAFLEKLFNPRHNTVVITERFLELLGVPYSKNQLEKDLEEHPDFPSLLSISDTLANYNIENISIQVDRDKMMDLPAPFITQIKLSRKGGELFTVVRQMDGQLMNFFNPERQYWQHTTVDDFVEKTSRVILLGEVKGNAHTKDFKEEIRVDKRRRLVSYLSALAIPGILALASILAFLKSGSNAFLPVLFSFLTLSGAILSILLLWYDIDRSNPVLQQVCFSGNNKAVNCAAILQSKGSRIAGVRWSAVGFIYFGGSLLSLLLGGLLNIKILYILSWLSLLAALYIPFSIYYQWKVVKQWCVLCLFVQLVLALQFILNFVGNWQGLISFSGIDQATAISEVVAFSIPVLMVSLALPAYQRAKESIQNEHELRRFKNNPEIFDDMLLKQKGVSEDPDGLGFILGNPGAIHKIIKVCNPYCGPCARVHPVVEELLASNPNVQVQMIFTAKDDENDKRAAAVKHLLAIAAENDKEKLKAALDDWYLPEKKDYNVFSEKYPVNGELEKQGEKLTKMSDWCEKMGVKGTPTFFVNGHKLPRAYEVGDLKYFLSV